MTDAEDAAHAKLLPEYRGLEEEFDGLDEMPEKIETRLVELEAAMEKVETRPLMFGLAEAGRAGAFVTLSRDGALAVDRGYGRSGDEPREGNAV